VLDVVVQHPQYQKVEDSEMKKKRFRVGLSTENPPQRVCTIVGPAIGTTDTRLVITVAPQKLI